MKLFRWSILVFFCIAGSPYTLEGQVKVTTFQKNFPTYNMGSEQSMPYLKDFNVPGLSFFRGSRSVYPYTFINDYKPGRKDKEYEVLRLENEFIYLDIIPELRGRIQGAVDKRNNWDFLYYNNVIKPAEISVRSAWISGGLEHNHPRGHGYTQFDRISYDIFNGDDGSKTIVIAEVEPVRMMKWEFEITLRPGQLYFETKGRFFSTAPFPVPFLSSNNAAMHTTEEMELIFPQETWASGHGFHPVKKWPFYGTDDADWNWLKNIKTQASAFADGTGLFLDYWGVYSHDEGIDAGSVMVSDHRTAPGKKYFTWGSHDFGKQWDYFLSDEDGGYVELQQQAYFANLGYGYAVLDPFEVKEFSVYWYPIKNTGGFVKATKDAAINFKRIDEESIRIVIQPTSEFPDAIVEIYRNGKPSDSFQTDLPVGDIFTRQLKLQSAVSDTLMVRVLSANKKEIICYANKIDEIKPEIDMLPRMSDSELTIDQLYAKGISDFHDPFSPGAEKTFNAILERDPLESRANRQLGIGFINRGQYGKAIEYLKTSLANDHFESCYHTHFLIGYAYLQLEDLTNAHVHLVQSSRKKAHLEASLYYLAKVQILKNNYTEAIRYLEEIPVSRLTHPDIHILRSYVYRKLGNEEMARAGIEDAFRIDPLNFPGWIEKLQMAEEREEVVEKINFLFDRKDSTFLGSQLYMETAQFYLELDDYEAALNVLSEAEAYFAPTFYKYPFIDYYIGYCLMNLGREEEAKDYYRKASGLDFTYVFPYRKKTVDVLKSVLSTDPADAIAHMYYGDLLYYLRRHDEAVEAWEKSYRIDPSNPRVTRNLAVGLFVQTGETDRTVTLLEEAFIRSGKNRRVYNELEQIYNLRKDYVKLEKLYDDNWAVIERSGDFALNCADLYLRKARYQDILTILEGTFFNAVEKGAGQPLRHSRYSQACIGLGEQLLNNGKYDEAIISFKKAYEYPGYLNEVKVAKPVTVRVDYLLGMALMKNNQKKEARKFFQKAASQEYNQISEDALYRAKALDELGQRKEAKALVSEFLTLLDKPLPLLKMPSIPDRSGSMDSVKDYLKSLAYGYLGDRDKEQQYLATALETEKDVVYLARFMSSYIPVILK